MAHAFTADPKRDRIVGRMEPVEIELVLEAMTQTRELLDEGASGTSENDGQEDLFARLSASMAERETPTDPALRRLLPDGNASNEEDTAEFRRLTEDSIRRQKQSSLDAAIAAFSRVQAESNNSKREAKVVLSRSEARSTMMALTDVRLVLAERLEIRTDEDAEALHELVEGLQTPGSARDLTAMYYDFMTWLSESVTLAYMGR